MPGGPAESSGLVQVHVTDNENKRVTKRSVNDLSALFQKFRLHLPARYSLGEKIQRMVATDGRWWYGGTWDIVHITLN